MTALVATIAFVEDEGGLLGLKPQEELLLIAGRLVGLPSQVSRQAGGGTPGNSETDEDDDSQYYPYPYGYPAREINKNALNTHRDSVNLIGLIRNVTLVSIVVHAVFGGAVTPPFRPFRACSCPNPTYGLRGGL